MIRLKAPAGPSGDAAPREAKRMLDAIWLVIAFVSLAAIGVPWFFRLVNLDLAPAVWAVFVFSLFHWLASGWLERPLDEGQLLVAAAFLHCFGVVFLALVWHLAGGIGNLSFLMVFALPVAAARLLGGRLQIYLSALLAAAAVCLVALCESPELRWYAALVFPPLEPLTNWLPVLDNSLAARGDPGLLAVSVLVFGFLLSALAVVIDSTDTHLFGFFRRMEKVDRDLRRAEELWRRILKAQPLPTALVFSDTGLLIEANSAFLALLPEASGPVAGRGLADLAGLREPERVAEALRGKGAELQCEQTLPRGTRFIGVTARRVGGAASNTSLVFLRDLTDEFLLRKAADAGGSPVILLDGAGRLTYFNSAAADAIGDLHPATHVADAFGPQRAGANWWQPGPSGEARRRVRLPAGLFEAQIEQFSFPGGWQRLHSIILTGPLPEPAAARTAREAMPS